MRSRQFYTHADVKHWDAVAQLRARFSNYDEVTTFAEHLEDIRTLERLLADKVVRGADFADCVRLRVAGAESPVSRRTTSPGGRPR